MSGELDVAVSARDLTDPQVIAWMTRFQEKVLDDHGYREGARTCAAPKDPPELCPVVSLADLFRSGAPQSSAERRRAARRRAALLLAGRDQRRPQDREPALRHPADAARPPAGGRSTTSSRRSTTRRLKRPEGVDAEVAGLPVLAAEANAKLASPWWRLGTLLGSLLLVFGVLWLLAGRNAAWRRVPLIPVALAAGWSGAILLAAAHPAQPDVGHARARWSSRSRPSSAC